jgi:hypothetical protein
MEKIVRLQVEVNQAVMDELERLMENGGLKTKKELLSTAFTLLKWAAREKALGNTICSINEQSLLRKELEMPFLETVAANERSKLREGAGSGGLAQTTVVAEETMTATATTSHGGMHDRTVKAN